MLSRLTEALIMNAEGNMAKHKLNVEVLLNNPAGSAECSDYIETIQVENDMLTHYETQLATIKRHFGLKTN